MTSTKVSPDKALQTDEGNLSRLLRSQKPRQLAFAAELGRYVSEGVPTPMHKSRLGNIVIDCRTDDLLSEARFWSSALGSPLPQDLDASSRFIQLVTPPGDVQVIIQRVHHESWAHLDIETDSIASEVARLERSGATVVSRNDGWVVMQAPSGQRFCVSSPYRGGFDQGANTWD